MADEIDELPPPTAAELSQRDDDADDVIPLPPLRISGVDSPVRVQPMPRRGKSTFNNVNVRANVATEIVGRSGTRARVTIIAQSDDVWFAAERSPLRGLTDTPTTSAALWPGGIPYEYTGTDALYLRSTADQFISLIIEHWED